MLYFKKLHPNAQLPSRGSEQAAGLDLYAIEPALIKPGAQVKIPTGLAVEIPRNHYGRVAPRSGLAVNHGVNVHAGVVDCDYRGEIHVCLINHGNQSVEIKPGDRIAQFIVEQISVMPAMWAQELAGTERGANGFGSTGY